MTKETGGTTRVATHEPPNNKMDGYTEHAEFEYYAAMEAYYEQPNTYRCDLCNTKREMTVEGFASSDWNQTREGNIACPQCTLRAIDRHITDRLFNRHHADFVGTGVNQ